MNPYEPPKRFDGVASSFGDKLLMSFLWVLMPMTMAYFSIRGHEKKVSLREELLMEAEYHGSDYAESSELITRVLLGPAFVKCGKCGAMFAAQLPVE